MLNIKLSKWAEYLLSQIGITIENLYENRKKLLMKPINDFFNKIFPDNIYNTPSIDNILEFTDLIIATYTLPKKHSYPFSLCKKLLEKTIKDKWIYSNDRLELRKNIIDFLKYISIDKINCRIKNNQIINTFINYIINAKNNNENIIEKLEMQPIENLSISIDKAKEYIKIFDEKYNKTNGTKTMSEIIETFIEVDLELSFNYDEQAHYTKIINFIKDKVVNYYIQPRFDYNDDEKIIKIDIYENGNLIFDVKSLEYTIEIGKISSILIKKDLPQPHDNEYEKSYWGFLQLAKKKYCGNKYEFDTNNYKLDFMGIVLKRRDNAPIVKEICSGILDYLINKKDPEGAKMFTINCLDKMFNNLYNIKYFLLSKTLKLKKSYKNWEKIAHVYLADKISKRTPGEEPQSGDRIEYAFIKNEKTNKKTLQGEQIETLEYIKENNLEIDYFHYLTNQIMNPALQFLELVDKNAKDIFTKYINTYSNEKIKNKKIIDYNLELDKMHKELKKKINSLNKSFNETNNFINNLKKKIK
jgi:hypothetical protein